ncbi:hypothetical protein [Aquimarina sp. Aq107]|uniref:hypothetical protein n=1 Tax=Aquimarina sp. Aq107 TaxID=1191912 RepID=UPI000D557DDD|nr:hypothetical protein [Aquimarina sp. Aq107]
MIRINWKKDLFSSKYRLRSHNQNVGEFDQYSFKNFSIGKLNDTKLKFEKKGFFNSETHIIDLNLNQPIGSIKFSNWGSGTTISLNGNNYRWNYDNFWHSKWSISQNQKRLIHYNSSTTSGLIESSVDSESLMLCGLFVHNYYILTLVIISTLIIIISTN